LSRLPRQKGETLIFTSGNGDCFCHDSINRISDAISRETEERAAESNFSVWAKDLLKTLKDWGADFAVGTAA
jgi:hypothetical protein